MKVRFVARNWGRKFTPRGFVKPLALQKGVNLQAFLTFTTSTLPKLRGKNGKQEAKKRCFSKCLYQICSLLMNLRNIKNNQPKNRYKRKGDTGNWKKSLIHILVPTNITNQKNAGKVGFFSNCQTTKALISWVGFEIRLLSRFFQVFFGSEHPNKYTFGLPPT